MSKANSWKVIVFALVASLGLGFPAFAQDASFACKALLCGQADWPKISYCVPIMQQAMWLNYLGIGVGVCAEAAQDKQNQQSGSGGANPANCPSGTIPLSAASGGYVVDAGGPFCGTPLTTEAKAALSGCAMGVSTGCQRTFTSKDVSVN